MPLFYPPDRLTTSHSSLVLSDNGTNASFTWNLGNLFLKDSSGKTIFTTYPSTIASVGVGINYHGFVGLGNASPTFNSPGSAQVFGIAEDASKTITQYGAMYSRLLYVVPGLDTDIGPYSSGINSAEYNVLFATGFDSTDGAGGSVPGTFRCQYVQTAGTVGGAALIGGGHTFRMYDASFNISLPASSPAWTELTGYSLSTLSLGGGIVPTRSYGIRVATAGNGTTAWGINLPAGNSIQMATTGKIIFGGSATALGINSMQRGATTTNITMTINSVVEYDWRSASFAPVSGATLKTLGLGTTQGWGGLYLQDTSASFTNEILSISSTALTANRTFTIDLVNASRTLKLTGNATIDQDVSTTGSPTHAGLTISDAGNIVLGTTTGTKIGTSTTQKLGFFNKAPVVQPSAYTVTNPVTDRAFDESSTTLTEVGNVLGTLIQDLQSLGLVG